MESLLEQEVSKRDGADMIEFLLDIMPSYNRVTMESDEILHEDLEEKFCQSLLHPHSSTNPPLHGRLTPYKCPNCHGRHICVETEVACLLCRSCGLQGPGGFEHGYQSMAGKDTHKAYQYNPLRTCNDFWIKFKLHISHGFRRRHWTQFAFIFSTALFLRAW